MEQPPLLTPPLALSLDCFRICTDTVHHCLRLNKKQTAMGHIRMLLDCAQACAINAEYMLHDAPLHRHQTEACAELCERCADTCEQIAPDDLVQGCIETLRRCATAYRRLGHKRATAGGGASMRADLA